MLSHSYNLKDYTVYYRLITMSCSKTEWRVINKHIVIYVRKCLKYQTLRCICYPEHLLWIKGDSQKLIPWCKCVVRGMTEPGATEIPVYMLKIGHCYISWNQRLLSPMSFLSNTVQLQYHVDPRITKWPEFNLIQLN